MYCIKHIRTQPHIYTWLMLLLLLLSGVKGWGQSTIASDGLNNSTTLFTLSGGVYYSGTTSSTADAPASSSYAVEGTHSRGIANGTATLTTGDLNTNGYSSIQMSFRLASYSITTTGNGADASDIVTVEISPNGGTNYYSTVRVLGNNNARWSWTSGAANASTAYDGNSTSVDFQPSAGGARTTDGYSTVTVTGLPVTSNLRIRVTLLNDGANERWLLDDFKVTGTAATPSITIGGSTSATATAFTTTYGTSSADQSFTIAGSNLTADISVAAVTGFEYSIDGGSTWGTTRTITQSSGSASATLRVRLTATATVSGSYNSQSINLSSTGATTRTISTAASGNAVSAKGLTITGLSAANKTYNGTTSASVSGTAAYSGLVNSESFTPSDVVSWAFADAAVGTNKTLSRTGSYTAPSGNYTITQPTLTANITAATLTVTGLTASNKAYDGLTSATTSGTAALSGIIGSDDVTLTGTPVFSFSSTAAGNSKTVTTTGYTLGGAQAGNYSLTQPSFTANITTVALTITGLTASDKNFDGNTTVSVSGTPAFSGLVNGESFTVSGSVTWAFPDANVGTGKTLTRTGDYNAPSGNYTVTQPTLTASINAVVPTAPVITGITPGNTELTVAFTAPTSNGGASISNYKFSTDNGASYTALSPASTSSPITITGLTNNTTYDIKIRAVNSVGDGAESNMQSGTPTTGTPPTVTASAATAIGATDATLNGEVTSEGTSPVTDRGFVYHTSPGVTIANNKTQSGSGLGLFALTPTLAVNTRYYFKSYAISTDGTSLSSELDFWTLANTPTAPTVSSPTSSTLGVTIGASDGNPSTTNYAIQETTSGHYVQANGSLSGTAVWQTAATWGTVTVTGLTHATTYTFKTKARNGNNDESAFGSTTNGSTSAIAPSVTTSAATSLTATGCTLNGNVTADGGSAITERGFVYKTTNGVTISDNKTTVSGTTGTYNLALTSLDINTRYYFRAYATNSISTTLGSELEFWTLANTPSAPTVGSPTSSTLAVTIGASDGNPSTTTYAIQETTSGNYVQANGSLSGTAVWQTAAIWGTVTVTGLTHATTYTFKTKARNGNNDETAFGSTTNGTTSAIAPSVTTSAATSATATGGTLNGNVTADGGSAITERGFVYKTTNGVTISDNKTTVSGTTGTYNLALTSLDVNTRYYFRAYATNSISTTLGSELDFWTSANTPAAPTVNTPTATTINVIIGSGDGNPSTTTYAIQETTSGNYVQANGSLSGTAIWQTAAVWGTETVTGLTAGTSYTFRVKARNGNNSETGFGSATVGITSGTIAIQDFESTPATPTLGYTNTNGNTITGSSGSSDGPASTNYFTSTNRAWNVVNANSVVTFSNLTGLGAYVSKQIEFRLASFSVGSTGNGADGGDIVTVEISLDGGINWSSEVRILGNGNAWWSYSATGVAAVTYDGNNSPTDFQPAGGGSRTTDGYSTIRVSLPDNSTQVQIKVTLLNSGTAERWVMDDVLLRGALVPSAPTLASPSASSITPTSATLGATITANGGTSITARGTVFSTTSPVTTSDNLLAEGGTTVAAYSHSRSGLSPQTLYFYAGYATNSTGIALSSESNFRTLSNVPTAQASGLTATTVSSTQIDLAITTAATFPASGATQAGYVVIYSTGTPALSSANGQAPAAGVGSIFVTAATILPTTPSTSISVTGLSSANTYNFLIIPYTWDGTNASTYHFLTSSAPTASATTNAGAPTLNASTATSITSTTATLGATVTSNGGASLTERGTVYSTTTPVTSTDNTLAEGGTSVSTFSHSRTGLSPQTLYYYAGYATSSAGTGLSAEGSFRTLSSAPAIQASGLTATAASSTQIDLSLTTPATFPGSGATQAGYVVIYSTGTPTLSSTNGQMPAAGVGTLTTVASILPATPSTTISVTGLNAATTYNFLVVPYTWDGTNAGTYNYLTASAPTATETTQAATYTWSGADNASWATSTNWTPNRTTPATTDILVFNSNTTLTVTGVPTQTIGKLEVSGSSTKITLQAASSSTILTIANSAGTDFTIAAGCELNISGSNTLSLVTAAGATSSISGSMKFTNAAHTLIPNDANAVTFNSGSSFTAGDLTTTGLTGNVFGPNTGTTYNGVVFASGSTYTQNEGNSPFAITQPNSRVLFQAGSNFIFSVATGSPGLSGRTYGNLEINTTSTNLNALIGSSPVTINGNLTITAAGSAVNFNHTGGVSIAGNISVASGQTLGFSPVSANTLTLSGTAQQTIGGSGTLTIGSNTTLSINNSSGVALSRNLTLPNTLTLTSGTLTVGANTLTLNGSISRTSGNIDASNASTTVVFSGSSAQSIPASTFTGNINNLTINNSAGLTAGQSLTISNALTLTSGTLTTGANTLTLNGSISRSSGNINASNTSATVVFSGSTAQSIPSAAFTGNINALTLDNSAGLTANQALTIAGALTLTSGTLTTGSVNLILNGSISRTSGNIDASNASTTVVFSGSTAQSIPASTFTGNINSLTLNNSAGLSMSQNLTIANTLTLTSGNLSVGANTLTLNGGYPSSNISNIITTSSSNLVFNCTGSGPFALPAFSALNQLTINSSGQNYTLSSSPTISGDVTLTNGTLVIGARTLTYTGSSITRTSGSIDASNTSATFIFNGSTAQSIPASIFSGTINNLTLDNSSGLTTSQNLTIGNTLALTSGTLNIGATELTLNGSISRTSGNIDASNASATVIFGGSSAQSIPASLFTGTINNITLNNTAGLSCSESLTLAGTLTLTSGALNISTHTFTLNGSVARTSGSIRSAGGNISVGGSSGNLSLHFDQTTSGTTNRLTNLTVNRTSSTITLGNAMQLTGTLNVTTGTLASAGNLTLVSNASGTARVAELVSGASITGNVTAEVYIPSVARRWRFLTPTVNSSTFNDWKGEMFIIGPGGSTNGFDASGTGSVFFYNEAATGNSSVGWTSISNTTNSIVPGTGYRTFIYGDRSNSSVISNSSLPQSAVTINTVGPLNTGNFALPVNYTANVNVNQDGWNMVGNPYHSPFDWNSYYNNCTTGCYTNIQPTIWVFDATTNNYKSYNASISSGTLSNGIIPTGSAFWLKANAASPSVTLKEEYKTAASHNQVFKNGNSELQLELRLDAINADFFILKHHASATANTDAFDISKMSGSVNIMSLTSSGQSLTLDCRPEITANDTVQLFVNGTNGSYTLKVNMLPANSKYYYLVDRKLSTTTLLAPQSVYTFNITNSDTTTFGRRFYMIVSTSGTLPVEWKSFSARRQQNRTQVEWSTATEFNASHFEVQRSSDNQHFVTMGKVNARNTHNNDYVFYDTDALRGVHYYRIRQVDLDQTETFTHVVAVNCDEESGGPIVTSAWPTVVTSEFNVALSNDSYNIQVYDINGRIQLNDDVTGERIQISTTGFGAGMYFMHIVSRTTGKSETLKFIKKE